MKVSNEGEAKQLVDWIYPENEVRQTCLTIFADSVIEANIHSRDKWVVKCEKNGSRREKNYVRLQMNGRIRHLIVCTLEKGQIWMALDKDLLYRSALLMA